MHWKTGNTGSPGVGQHSRQVQICCALIVLYIQLLVSLFPCERHIVCAVCTWEGTGHFTQSSWGTVLFISPCCPVFSCHVMCIYVCTDICVYLQIILCLFALKLHLTVLYPHFFPSHPFQPSSPSFVPICQQHRFVLRASFLFVSFCLVFLLSPMLSPSIFISICFFFSTFPLWRLPVFPHYWSLPMASSRHAALSVLGTDVFEYV